MQKSRFHQNKVCMKKRKSKNDRRRHGGIKKVGIIKREGENEE